MKRMNAKAFNAFLPEPLHAFLKQCAQEHADEQGGHASINRVLVKGLLDTYGDAMTDDERQACVQFLAQI
jgi:hypothetical protein